MVTVQAYLCEQQALYEYFECQSIIHIVTDDGQTIQIFQVTIRLFV